MPYHAMRTILKCGFLLLLLSACASQDRGSSLARRDDPANTLRFQEERIVRGQTSPVPLPEDHRAYAQLMEQAADHWRDMATEVAQRVYKAYEDRDDLLEVPIFVAPPNNRPFTVAFYHLLRTELVSRGLQVSYNREPYSVLLEYSVQTVPFDPERFKRYAPRQGLAEGSNHELIVNARLFFRNRFVMHCASIRYINDADLALYIDPQNHDPLAESLRAVRITRK